MSGLRIVVEDEGTLELTDERIGQLEELQIQTLLEGIGAELESQTRRRIIEEKKAPDGAPWEDWLESYAGSKHGNAKNHEPHPDQLRTAGGHSILQLDGGLLDSIQYEVTAGEVAVGSNLVYAATHQFGDPSRNIIDRPFVGLSVENEEAIDQLVTDFLQEALR